MALILEIAAGVVLGLFAYSVLQLGISWVWREIESRPWVLWTLGITGVVIYLVWLLDRPK